ncbi:MAG: cytochrome b/b6 domain-containing protein [Nocardioidaceae bacterium]|nr:cytochrome b/b6 domain-containing protein [Nocardioidaceae bacterium]NUS51774.1 cytochrome b/b6 domain-containing protein [Nocardioidaceae bacterium]
MATDVRRRADVVERYGRSARWLHAGVYVTVLVLMGTGLWLLAGNEGDPSPLSRLTGVADTRLHVWFGWAFVTIVLLGLVLGVRAARTFVLESLRVDAGDLAWFRRWPQAVLTGRFTRHEGHFDPGQRIANVALVLSLLTVTASGVAMALLHGGPAFVWLVPVHTWSTYVLVALVVGHVAIASGILPGYHGVWHSMHLGGRVPTTVARRVWPGWTERYLVRGTPETTRSAAPLAGRGPEAGR